MNFTRISVTKSHVLVRDPFSRLVNLSRMEEAKRDVGWGDAAFWSSIFIAVVIVAVGITFFVILILTSMRQVDVYFEAYAVPNAVKAAAPAC